jgi:2,3-bisphosphoglycerate-independent phosphoglycerate mutase
MAARCIDRLVSDGGVHSHNTHLYACLSLPGEAALKQVFVHCLMDGRDVPPDSGRASSRSFARR